jgi:hypothetical protein
MDETKLGRDASRAATSKRTSGPRLAAGSGEAVGARFAIGRLFFDIDRILIRKINIDA